MTKLEVIRQKKCIFQEFLTLSTQILLQKSQSILIKKDDAYEV